MPPVNAWAIEQLGRHIPSKLGPSTTCRVGNRATPLPTPPVDTGAINADSSSATARPNKIAAQRARGGGVRGRPRRNADATCQCVGHRATRLTPPVGAAHATTPIPPVDGHREMRPTPPFGAAHATTLMPPVDAWAIRAINAGARGDDERGVGARDHQHRNAADTTRQRAGNVEKY